MKLPWALPLPTYTELWKNMCANVASGWFPAAGQMIWALRKGLLAESLV